ncbi:DoxX family protein [Streptomyces sp. NPDC050504]|uniref:DoxX family protein n=1 Tax=Streptomyces sp. NPDC050504 TaxID=3365618 RepID=UPI0037A77390
MYTRLNQAQPYVLGAFRAVVGLLFTCHGASTLFDAPVKAAFGTPEIGSWPGWYAAVIQLVCGILVLVGFGTRFAALLASGSMAYAYFVEHQPDGLFPLENGGGMAALYSWAFLLLVFTGPGAFALDRYLNPAERATAQAEEQTRKSTVAA